MTVPTLSCPRFPAALMTLVYARRSGSSTQAFHAQALSAGSIVPAACAYYTLIWRTVLIFVETSSGALSGTTLTSRHIQVLQFNNIQISHLKQGLLTYISDIRLKLVEAKERRNHNQIPQM